MSRESRLIAGLLLVVLPTVMLGGVSILTLLIGTINLWNRVQIGLRAVHPVEEPVAAAA